MNFTSLRIVVRNANANALAVDVTLTDGTVLTGTARWDIPGNAKAGDLTDLILFGTSATWPIPLATISTVTVSTTPAIPVDHPADRARFGDGRE